MTREVHRNDKITAPVRIFSIRGLLFKIYFKWWSKKTIYPTLGQCGHAGLDSTSSSDRYLYNVRGESGKFDTF